LGQLIEKSGNGGTTLLMYDESGHILGEYSSTGALIEETIWMGDTPVATLFPNGSSITIYYIHSDHLGTPRKITNSSTNAVVWRWDPDTFGSMAPSITTIIYNLRFPGQYYLPETGLMYNYFRDYDPSMGRYLESDPIGLLGGSLSTYGYVHGDAIDYADPRGLESGAALSAINRAEGYPPAAFSQTPCPRCQGSDRWTYTTHGTCPSGDIQCGMGLQAGGFQGPYYSTTRVVSRRCMLTAAVLAEPVKFSGSTLLGKWAPAWLSRFFGWSATTTAAVSEIAVRGTSATMGLFLAPYTVDVVLRECACDN
jgi:RHS repeat-associated protein